MPDNKLISCQKFEKYEGHEAKWYPETPMEILISKEKGRGLFSAQELKKGDVLLKATPYVSRNLFFTFLFLFVQS